MGRPKKTKVIEEKKEEIEKPKVKCYCCGKDKKEIENAMQDFMKVNEIDLFVSKYNEDLYLE